MLVTQLISDVQVKELPRVEVRQCGTEQVLQIVAWKEKSDVPSLVADTTDFTIVQSAARDNVFMIETSGGPRDIVWVVLYTNGIPPLELKRVIKGTAAVTINESLFTLVISGIYAGDAPPRTETHSYKLSLDDLFSPGRRKRDL